MREFPCLNPPDKRQLRVLERFCSWETGLPAHSLLLPDIAVSELTFGSVTHCLVEVLHFNLFAAKFRHHFFHILVLHAMSVSHKH